MAPVIVWFRRDLRLADNPALHAAVQTGRPIIPVFIDETNRDRPMGPAGRWWLHYSLQSLGHDIAARGGHLMLQRGEAEGVLNALIEQTGAETVFWNRRYEKDGIAIDTLIKAGLTERGLRVETFNGSLLVEPWERKTKTGGYYKVFTPFWKAARSVLDVPPLLPKPERLNTPDASSLSLADLDLLPTRPDWGAKMTPFWEIGEAGAQTALSDFLSGPGRAYKTDRDKPGVKGTSRLSPHLAFGEISPRQIWHKAMKADHNPDKFLSEIGWREFAYTLLFYNPDFATKNFRADFDAFEWNNDPDRLERWQKGLTGYPIVDAGMRELWATGWQHNRVRMVTASFLIKHLRQDWRHGEAWFHDTLVDFDPANNPAGWQWVAGSGADAAPYFRIFNPFGQGEKFDANGDYVRRWVPELKHLPNKYIHKPWEASAGTLAAAGVTLGKTYPKPIVDHKIAREKALAAWQDIRN